MERPWEREPKREVNLAELLEYINPAALEYSEWLKIGMALKAEGYPLSAWESWSRRDPARYKASGASSCAAKWEGFSASKSAGEVSGATIVQMAKDNGWHPEHRREPGAAVSWDAVLDGDSGETYERAETVRPLCNPDGSPMSPAQMLVEYLDALFSADDIIGYCAQSRQIKDKYIPADKGIYTRTAGAIIEAANKRGTIEGAIGSYDPAAGAWIRINPLDGGGIKNDNVADYRFALVESDTLPVEIQLAKITDLNLPVAAIVHSGRKSIHAIVRIDAGDRAEYRARVERLYKVCADNGLEVDTQNKNPSRLSRLPGAVRGGNLQYLVALNVGAKSWDEWEEQVEEAEADMLPEIEPLGGAWADPPEKAPELIEGVLRKGHKMLVTGPSKAGKSMLLIELAISLATGREWLGHKILTGGKVLYLNLEIDRPSCIWRFVDVARAMGFDAPPAVDIWHLRGTAQTLDKLAPKLIRRARAEGYIAVIIDPIYKVITGDENSAPDMAKFCGVIDTLCASLGAAVIYCHHHSKGAQGGKRSMDRASGSGVFARDMDALIDMIELPLSATARTAIGSGAWCRAAREWLTAHHSKLAGGLPTDTGLVENQLRQWLEARLESGEMSALVVAAEAARKAELDRSAWRLTYTTREFAQPADTDIWYEFPAHRVDETGLLGDIQPESEADKWRKGLDKMKQSKEEKQADAADEFALAFDALSEDGGAVAVADLADELGKTETTITRTFGKSRQRNPEIVKQFALTKDTSGEKIIIRKADSTL